MMARRFGGEEGHPQRRWGLHPHPGCRRFFPAEVEVGSFPAAVYIPDLFACADSGLSWRTDLQLACLNSAARCYGILGSSARTGQCFHQFSQALRCGMYSQREDPKKLHVRGE